MKKLVKKRKIMVLQLNLTAKASYMDEMNPFEKQKKEKYSKNEINKTKKSKKVESPKNNFFNCKTIKFKTP